jgi:hypothetical protein
MPSATSKHDLTGKLSKNILIKARIQKIFQKNVDKQLRHVLLWRHQIQFNTQSRLPYQHLEAAK